MFSNSTAVLNRIQSVARHITSLRLALGIAVLVFGSADLSRAAVIYSNLGPNDSFFTSPGTYPVWNLTSGGFIHRAASFTVPGSQNVQFGSADLGLHLQNGSNLAQIQLTNNNAGFPGSVIESINFPLPAPSANPVVVNVPSQTNPTLIAGNTYWIVASVQFAGTMATWGPNNTGALGGNATRTNFQNGQWFNQGPGGVPSLRINSFMVPEPSALVMVVLGTASLALRRRRSAHLFRHPS
jgi:hypothetical protein